MPDTNPSMTRSAIHLPGVRGAGGDLACCGLGLAVNRG